MPDLPELMFTFSERPTDGYLEHCKDCGVEPDAESWKRWWIQSLEMAADTYAKELIPGYPNV